MRRKTRNFAENGQMCVSSIGKMSKIVSAQTDLETKKIAVCADARVGFRR